MNFLAIDTSTDICSVCLYYQGDILDSIEKNIDKNHSKTLAVLVNKIVQKNKFDLTIIDSFILSIGPSSYSGLKVGSSFIKGLAYSLNKPITPINAIEAMNFLINDKGPYYVALYSHRDYIYYQEYYKGNIKSKQFCDKISNLKKIKIYGYKLNFEDYNIIEVKPTSLNLINYAIANEYLINNNVELNVSPIYLSSTK